MEPLPHQAGKTVNWGHWPPLAARSAMRSAAVLVLTAHASLALAQTAAPAPAASPASSTAPVAAGAAGPGDPAAAPPKRERKPLVAVVLDGTKKVLGYPAVQPYVPLEVAPEPPVEPSEVKTVEIVEPVESLVLVRPWLSSLIGAVENGARVPVRGVIHSKSGRGCSTHLWYALEPFGYLCSKSARKTDAPATDKAVLQVKDGERLPYRYVMELIKEGEKIPMWASLLEKKKGAEPERFLEKGDSIAVDRKVTLDGVPHWVSVEGKVLPVKGTSLEFMLGSEWHGEALDDKTVFPFGWTLPEKVKVWGDDTFKGKPTEVLEPRTRVAIVEETGAGKRRALRIGDGRWLKATDVDEVRLLPRPKGITEAAQWIDVDLGEQVLVAYEGEKPVFATLTSSGRAIATPRGNYPIWSKVSSISMKSQPYEDKAYFVNKVPWVMFFQAHNAIHGAYWHDRFGVSKSHGCVNVSPLDARHLFEWATPPLPAGWTGYRAPNLLASPTVHVRNSHEKPELVQDRPIGPPDRELEMEKLEDAEERRAAAGTAAGPDTAGGAAGTSSTGGSSGAATPGAPSGMQP